MNLKCVHCEGEAEYLVKGTSYCKEHLPAHYRLEVTPNVDWDKLKSEVKDAVGKKCQIDFYYKDIHQIKYQQKYAEVLRTENIVIFSVIVFTLAGGIGLISSYGQNRELLVLILGLIITLVGFVLLLFKWDPYQKTCNKIILDAEKRIQTLSKEKEKE